MYEMTFGSLTPLDFKAPVTASSTALSEGPLDRSVAQDIGVKRSMGNQHSAIAVGTDLAPLHAALIEKARRFCSHAAHTESTVQRRAFVTLRLSTGGFQIILTPRSRASTPPQLIAAVSPAASNSGHSNRGP